MNGASSTLDMVSPILGRFESGGIWPVIRGWLAVSLVMTVLGVVLYGAWVIAGSGVGFLLVIGLLFVLLVVYSVYHSRSIASAVSWISDPDGILLLALGFASILTLVVLVL